MLFGIDKSTVFRSFEFDLHYTAAKVGGWAHRADHIQNVAFVSVF